MDDGERMDIGSDDVASLSDLLGDDEHTDHQHVAPIEGGPEGDPDQEPSDVEHGSAPAATAPKPPRED